ncbi:hypothetical protein V8E53_006018 [Lactarius tabidus]
MGTRSFVRVCIRETFERIFGDICLGGQTLYSRFFTPWARPGEPNKAAFDPQVGERLWSWLKNETKDY